MATETPVSKTSPAIKQIIAATVGASWGNKKIVMHKVPSSWKHTEYIDDKTLAWYLNLATLRSWRPDRPHYGGPSVIHPAPKLGEALIHVLRLRGPQSMEIIVQEDAIDSATVAVVTDALLERDKKSAAEAARRCGVAGGLCLALAEAHANRGGAEPTLSKRASSDPRHFIVAIGHELHVDTVQPPRERVADHRDCLAEDVVNQQQGQGMTHGDPADRDHARWEQVLEAQTRPRAEVSDDVPGFFEGVRRAIESKAQGARRHRR